MFKEGIDEQITDLADIPGEYYEIYEYVVGVKNLPLFDPTILKSAKAIENADFILAWKDGKRRERGTDEQLLDVEVGINQGKWNAIRPFCFGDENPCEVSMAVMVNFCRYNKVNHQVK